MSARRELQSAVQQLARLLADFVQGRERPREELEVVERAAREAKLLLAHDQQLAAAAVKKWDRRPSVQGRPNGK